MQTKKLIIQTCFVIALTFHFGCKSDADEALPENYIKIDGRVYSLTSGYTDSQPNEFLGFNSNLVYSHEILLTPAPLPLSDGAVSISLVPLSSDTGELPSGNYPVTFRTEAGALFGLTICDNRNSSSNTCERFFYATETTVLTFSVVEDSSSNLKNLYTVNVTGKVYNGTGSNRKEFDLEVKYVGGFSRFDM